jgi:DNA-binding HxlR family transcriptional regulator
MRPKSDWKGCPVRYAASVLGDPWTLVLLRDLMFKGKHHFRDFLAEEAPATNVLADRLAHLEAAGIVARRRDPERSNQVICELTEKGVALVPTFLAMIDWSATYDKKTEVPGDFTAAYRADPIAFAEDLVAPLKVASRNRAKKRGRRVRMRG